MSRGNDEKEKISPRLLQSVLLCAIMLSSQSGGYIYERNYIQYTEILHERWTGDTDERISEGMSAEVRVVS